jgi:hypothetical protein
MKKAKYWILSGITLALVIFIAASLAFTATTATVSTEKPKYAVGDPMTINGAGFTASSTMTVTVERPDHLVDVISPSVVTDQNGSFSAIYNPPMEPGRYKITATDGVNTALTATTEADSLAIDFKQCAQNDSANGKPLGVGYCNWINSIINAGNGKLYEGNATEQQVVLESIGTGTHTLRIGIQATKGGLHTYDWLVSDAQHQGTTNTASDASPDSTSNSEKASTLTQITLQLNRCGPQLSVAGQAPTITDSCVALVNGALMSPSPSFNSIDIPVPDDPFLSSSFDPTTTCGNSTQCRINAYEAQFGNRTVRLYTDGVITGTPTMTLEHRDGKTSGAVLAPGGDTGDSYIWYTITWTSSGTNAMLVGAADISLGDSSNRGQNWGAAKGAANVSGAPYHFYFIDLDGVGGSLDNQMDTGAIFTLPATPTIVTDIQNASNVSVLNGTVETGTVIHDTATVDTGSATQTIPSGSSVTFHLFTGNTTCTGTPTDQTGVAITSGVQSATASSATVSATNPGGYSYLADFTSGNTGTVLSKTGTVCEPVNVANPSTTLVLQSSTPADGSNAEAGGTATIVVRETNTGNVTITNVSVTGGGKCTSFTGGATTLAPGAFADFTCTFTIAGGTNSWTADGNGTDTLGNPVPSTGEHAQGSLFGVIASTTLVLQSSTPADGSNVEAVGTATIVVRETNTGNSTITSVSVTGGGKCATFTGGATTLAAGAFADFTCTFAIAAGSNAWSADGHGTDLANIAVPATGEHAQGSFFGVTASTTLTLLSSVPADGSNAEAGGTATIVVRETNTGNSTIHSVSVTGGGKCATFTGGATTLDAGAHADFTCTFTIAGGSNAWSADGHGTDLANNAVPATGEHAAGSLFGVTASTTLTLLSSVPANGSSVEVGTPVTIVVRETNTGNSTIHSVSVTGGGQCATFTGGATTLNAGDHADFTCTFTTALGANSWFADGHGTDLVGNAVSATGEHTSGSLTGLQTYIVVNKISHSGTSTFNFSTSNFSFGTNSLSTVAGALGTTAPSGGATTGLIAVHPGIYSVGEPTQPASWQLDASTCTIDGTNPFGTPSAVGGVNVSWTFTAPLGATVTCTFDDSLVVLTTRTQGFWATHTGLANTVWNGGTIPSGPVSNPVVNPADMSPVGSPDAYLCGVLITALPTTEENILMGGFWSQISQTSSKAKRTDIDQARMQMVQQYLAAVLNVHLFGSGSEALLSTARAAYCGNNASAIQTQIGVLGNFNQSGDSQVFTPGVSATTQLSKAQADIDAWDQPQYPGLSDVDDHLANPNLALVKNLNQGLSGLAVTTDFTLTATCTAGPCTGSVGGNGGIPSTSITEGTYSLTDAAHAGITGYTPGPWSCAGSGSFTLSSTTAGTATLFIGNGATVSCSITNSHL